MKDQITEFKILKSDRFLLWVVLGSLPLLCSNMYYVYHKLSVLPEPWRNRVALGVALVLAGFIILYTVRKNYKMAGYFAWFEAGISAYYYMMTIGWHTDIFPAFGFTFILPAAIYYGAKEIEKKKENELSGEELAYYQNLVNEKDDKIYLLEDQIKYLGIECKELKEKNSDILSTADNKVDEQYLLHVDEKINEKNQIINILKDKVKNLESQNADILLQGDKAIEDLQQQLNDSKKVVIEDVSFSNPIPLEKIAIFGDGVKDEIENGDYLNELNKKQETPAPAPMPTPDKKTHFWYQQGKED